MFGDPYEIHIAADPVLNRLCSVFKHVTADPTAFYNASAVDVLSDDREVSCRRRVSLASSGAMNRM